MPPVYCYETDDGVVIERFFPVGRAPRQIVVEMTPPVKPDDPPTKRHLPRLAYARRSYAAERASVPASSGWPMTCFASGVGAAQAGQLRDFLAKSGVPTEVTKDGDPVYRDPKHRKKALKARGMFDRASYT